MLVICIYFPPASFRLDVSNTLYVFSFCFALRYTSVAYILIVCTLMGYFRSHCGFRTGDVIIFCSIRSIETNGNLSVKVTFGFRGDEHFSNEGTRFFWSENDFGYENTRWGYKLNFIWLEMKLKIRMKIRVFFCSILNLKKCIILCIKKF